MFLEDIGVISDINQLLRFTWDCLDHVIFLYFSGGILSLAFAVYIVRKVSKLFNYIIH